MGPWYNYVHIYFLGKDTPPAVSLHGRPKEGKHFDTPAPGDYNPDKAEKVIHDNAPKYTFGLKTNKEKAVDTPGTCRNNGRTFCTALFI